MNFALRFFTDQPWAISVIGVLVASLAFLVGRRWIVPRTTPQLEEPAEESLNMLSTATLKSTHSDRRSAPRRKEGNRVEVYLTDETRPEPLYGWVIDRSLGGLCLNVEKPLIEGSILNVRPRKAPKTAPWITVEIRSCRPEGSEWEVGCRFLKQPQWNDLLLFG
jgi:PilZ domain